MKILWKFLSFIKSNWIFWWRFHQESCGWLGLTFPFKFKSYWKFVFTISWISKCHPHLPACLMTDFIQPENEKCISNIFKLKHLRIFQWIFETSFYCEKLNSLQICFILVVYSMYSKAKNYFISVEFFSFHTISARSQSRQLLSS